MRLVCSPSKAALPTRSPTQLPVLLYGRIDSDEAASVGAAVAEEISRRRLVIPELAWDLLSVSLSVVTADLAVLKPSTSDGWTRDIDLTVAVSSPDFWSSQVGLIQQLLSFLTTDRWNVSFTGGALPHEPPSEPTFNCEGSVALLSGGIDSLVGVLDLVAAGQKPFVVSQIVLGDGEKQTKFASDIGGGLSHLQINHNASAPGSNDINQRARSLVFLGYGVVAATSLKVHHEGGAVKLYVSENGFISVNPPLTDARIGSLSTRTTHPVFISLFQQLIRNAGLNIELTNPYQFKTKGEMLTECADQAYLIANAHVANSCGRYRRMGFRHCGRCVPCLIRRAAFHRWSHADRTVYVYNDLGRDDSEHSGFDDVRSAAMAMQIASENGVDALLGASLASPLIADAAPYQSVVERGLKELEAFLSKAGVK